jgi:hypothetical protein
MKLFSIGTAGAVFGLMLTPTLAASPEAPHLSQAQAKIVTTEIAKLKYSEERALASGWTDAKKVAEFICRPLATDVLKRRFKDADRVFLGTDDPKTLHLVSDRLKGSGQVRTGNSWRNFTFSCELDPRTGKALSFNSASD